MQLQTFVLPVVDTGNMLEDVNKFLRSHRILQVDRQFCSDGVGYWSLLVTYMDGDVSTATPAQRDEVRRQRREDEKQRMIEELTTEERARFERMREVRKRIAEESAVKAFMVLTDRELLRLSKQTDLTLDALRGADVDPSRVQKYGTLFVSLTTMGEIPSPADETRGPFD